MAGSSARVCLVSHEEDIDGLGSAAIGVRLLRTRCFVLAGYGRSSWPLAVGELSRRCGRGVSEVLFADLNPSPGMLQALRSYLGACGSPKIRWVDHHVWGDEALALAQKMGVELHIDRSRTASENLAILLGGEGDPVSRALVELSRDTDYGIFSHPLSEPLTTLIRFALYREGDRAYLRRLVLSFSKGVLWDHEASLRWRRAGEEASKALSEALSSYRRARIGGRDAVVVIADPILSSRKILRALGESYEIAFVAYRNGSVTIARGSPEINCAEVARMLGGGGHPHIAGAEVGAEAVSKGLEGLVEFLTARIPNL